MLAANEPDRGQRDALCPREQQRPGQCVRGAYVDQGDTGEAAQPAAAPASEWQGMAQPNGPTGVGLLPRLWVLERRFGGAARFRRLARHYERRALPRPPFHFFAFAGLCAAKGVLRLNRP